MFRTIVELSCMSNNDEYIIYTPCVMTNDNIKKEIQVSSYDDPHIVVSRPVFNIEILEGLKLKETKAFDETVPDSTRLIDAVFRLKEKYAGLKKIIPDMPPETYLLKFVAIAFYDCMSGGCPTFILMIIKYYFTIIKPEYNREAYVYPSDKERGYDTLQDFLNKLEDLDINKLIDVLAKIKNEKDNKLQNLLTFDIGK